MATGARIRSLVRWVLLGRRDGLRSRLRRRVGVCTSVDASEEPHPGQETARAAAPAPPAEPEELDGWVRLFPLSELADGEVVEAMVEDRALAVARVGDAVHALDNNCPHAGGPLGDGVLEGCELTCPWHGWTFDVTSGTCTMDPSLQAETAEAKVHGGHVYVRA